MSIEQKLLEKTAEAIKSLYGQEPPAGSIVFQKTNKEFEGDVTVVVFPFLKLSKKTPELTAADIGNYINENLPEVKSFNVVKGFLNIIIDESYWLGFFNKVYPRQQFGFAKEGSTGQSIMIEYPSPNTNKPLHLGHLRNIFLGYSISQVLRARGHKVIHTCLYNDRGTNISKSMLAWQMFGNGETPESAKMKGDHFVGKYYVEFSNAYKKEIDELKASGLTEEEAKAQSRLNASVNDLTVRWENGDPEVRALWTRMNGWVYDGFNETYKVLNISPDKSYYESDVYNLGKETVKDGLEKGIFYKKDDGSVWIDLTADGLDHKVVLRSNGTTVYITQDMAIASEKDKDFKIDRSIYVVGNEQEYHFKVLFLILKKLGYSWADKLYHLSYGMVDLPTGKMKSREGTVVDADDLIEEVTTTARETTQELGKIDDFSSHEAEELYRVLGLGALKYFILKIDPKKRMIFNPKESVDFNGHTGPFIQYTHARVRSVLRKAGDLNKTEQPGVYINAREKEVIKLLATFPAILEAAAEAYDPSPVANYAYELAKTYNQFYHDVPILKEENEAAKIFRLQLSEKTGEVIKASMSLLGIEVPERM